jgi:hypothetical protein
VKIEKLCLPCADVNVFRDMFLETGKALLIRDYEGKGDQKIGDKCIS